VGYAISLFLETKVIIFFYNLKRTIMLGNPITGVQHFQQDVLESFFTTEQIHKLIFENGLSTIFYEKEGIIYSGLIVGVLFSLKGKYKIKAEPVIWDINNNIVVPPNKIEYGLNKEIVISPNPIGLPEEFKDENGVYINDFVFVFVDRYYLEYFTDIIAFPHSKGIHVSRIVIKMDIGDNGNYKLYQGLKTSVYPKPNPIFFSEQEGSAYVIGPICPPIWKFNILSQINDKGIVKYLTIDKLAEPFNIRQLKSKNKK
jgi:hypothetical protein